ncbi:CMP-N-acetylneuraminate-beta-galactosamide-alpha-2,3-sialyltransferase 1-like [Vanacampus margaritifer]
MRESPDGALSGTPFEGLQKRWKVQREKRPFSFFNETVDKLFTIFPPTPQVEQQSSDRCRTCAVVGNSANLKGSHYGQLIDYHDIVIRELLCQITADINKILIKIISYCISPKNSITIFLAFIKYFWIIWHCSISKSYLQLCFSCQVNVFGFGADREGNWSHYFEILRNKRLRTGPHAGMQEYEFIRMSDQKKVISLFKGL